MIIILELIKKIKEKKPLNRLGDNYVNEFLQDFLKQNPKIQDKLIDLKKKDFERIVKNVRNELNKSYGQFWINDKEELSSHRSTKERMKLYDKIYKFIFSITGKPKTILDLACGKNYLTYKQIDKEAMFYPVELTEYDCLKIKEYFKKNKIKGEVIQADLRKGNKFPKADVCFIFKTLDSIEAKGHKLAEELIKNINAKYFVISFSTATMRNKNMNHPQRRWFEVMLNRLNLKFVKHEEYNEVFYIIQN